MEGKVTRFVTLTLSPPDSLDVGYNLPLRVTIPLKKTSSTRPLSAGFLKLIFSPLDIEFASAQLPLSPDSCTIPCMGLFSHLHNSFVRHLFSLRTLITILFIKQ